MTLDFSLRFLIALGSILVPFWPPKWLPRGAREPVLRPLGGVQDGLEIVLVRFSCRLVVRDRFFCRLGVVLGSFLGAPGVVLVLLSAFQLIESTHQLIKPSSHRFNPSTHRFNSSTRQPMALRHFLTRPGGLRAARLNMLIAKKNKIQRQLLFLSICSRYH